MQKQSSNRGVEGPGFFLKSGAAALVNCTAGNLDKESKLMQDYRPFLFCLRHLSEKGERKGSSPGAFRADYLGNGSQRQAAFQQFIDR
jgi:hypothetical protein